MLKIIMGRIAFFFHITFDITFAPHFRSFGLDLKTEFQKIFRSGSSSTSSHVEFPFKLFQSTSFFSSGLHSTRHCCLKLRLKWHKRCIKSIKCPKMASKSTHFESSSHPSSINVRGTRVEAVSAHHDGPLLFKFH